jgi:hypothetical protein
MVHSEHDYGLPEMAAKSGKRMERANIACAKGGSDFQYTDFAFRGLDSSVGRAED